MENQPVKPTIGRIVQYRSQTGHYTLPAIVTAVKATLWQEGVDRGDVPDLESDMHVHLQVFSPGAKEHYNEHNVPYGALDAESNQPHRTWCWPPRV